MLEQAGIVYIGPGKEKLGHSTSLNTVFYALRKELFTFFYTHVLDSFMLT